MSQEAELGRFKNLSLVTLFGFASGLPLALSGFTLQMWLTSDHLPLSVIGLTANIGFAYLLKFLWAPVFDEVKPLFWGRRRGWLLTVQIALIGSIIALALSDPVGHTIITLVLAAFVAFFSASQDVLIDAWRIESFAPRAQGTALAGYIWGYRAALLVTLSGVIVLSTVTGWHVALLCVAGFALAGPIATIFAREPDSVVAAPMKFRAAVIEPAAEFLARKGAWVIAAFIALHRLGEALAQTMLAPYYTHLGFNRAQIALTNSPIALAATLAGATCGGLLVARLGVGRALLLTALVQTSALVMYPLLGLYPGHAFMLVATAALESFAGGFADASFLTYLSGLCAPQFTATQYALFSSLSPLALRTVAGFSGFIVAGIGYMPFYIAASFAALPGLALMIWILRYYPPAETKAGISAPLAPH